MTVKKIVDILTLLSPVMLMIGILFGIARHRVLDGTYRILLLYLCSCLLADLGSRLTGRIYGNNLVFIPGFSFFELFLFTFLYYKCLLENKNKLLLALSGIAMLFMLWEISYLWQAGPAQFQSYAKVAGSFIILLLTIRYFFEKAQTGKITDKRSLRLNSFILGYFALTLIFFLPLNFLINVASTVKYYIWLANLLLTLSFYTYLTIEIWKNGYNLKPSHSG